ncbi:MAG: type 1 periplasmic binding fold superfamily protein [Flavobacteriaceae bacterium]
MKTIKITFLSLISSLLFISCEKDDKSPELIQEEELITSVIVTLNTSEGQVVLSSKDLDGDGPNVPVVSVVGALKQNTIYNGTIQLLNESVSPSEDITLEVKEEAEEHQFFYDFNTIIKRIEATDVDKNNNPLGIQFELETEAIGTANIGFTLRHLPTKPNTGAATAGGETDIAVTFEVSVVE